MRRATRGFTLIELLAVVALVALVGALVLPRIGIGGERRTLSEAEQLAASLELARQRAAVTGVPHRLHLDLDRQGYRLEWLAREEEQEAPPAGADAPAPHPADRDWARAPTIPMTPPQRETRSWRPVPGPVGATSWITEGIAVVAVQTPEGVATEGSLFATFGPDGSGDAAVLEMADEQGNRLTLEVAPLADAVRIAWGGLEAHAGG